jgi:hypothetical protein
MTTVTRDVMLCADGHHLCGDEPLVIVALEALGVTAIAATTERATQRSHLSPLFFEGELLTGGGAQVPSLCPLPPPLDITYKERALLRGDEVSGWTLSTSLLGEELGLGRRDREGHYET